MSILKSRLFVVVDAPTSKKLEDCASGIPNEHSTHFTVNSKGEHIRLVQVALNRVRNREPGLNIPAFKVDGNYSPDFAKAVFAYKKARGIKNFSGKIDDIVGKKTIISLDREEGPVEVLPVPSPPADDFAKPLPVRTITKKVFRLDTTPKSEKPDDGSGPGLSTRDLTDALADIFNSIQDPDFFLGKEDLSKRRIEFISEDFGVNFVDKATIVDIRIFGGATTISTTTTTFTYRYGERNANVQINSTFESKINGTTKTTERTIEIVPRDTANKSEVIVPSRLRSR